MQIAACLLSSTPGYDFIVLFGHYQTFNGNVDVVLTVNSLETLHSNSI